MFFLKLKNIFKKTIPNVIFLIIIFIALILFMNYNFSGINNIEDYYDIFSSVQKLEFYKSDNNFYTIKDPNYELKVLKKVKIDLESIINTDKFFDYKVIVNDKYIIYFNSDFTLLWVDDTNKIKINLNMNSFDINNSSGLSPSCVYIINNSNILEDLFEKIQ